MPLDIQPKFSIGQQVFQGSAPWNPIREECPDCLGSCHWTVSTPKGEQFLVPCNTCWEGFSSTGKINVYGYNPMVDMRTIGSVRIDTGDADEPVTYMCRETGVGSGQVYRESSLFATHDEAQLHASLKAIENVAKLNEQEAEKRNGRKKERTKRPVKAKTN